MRPLIFIPGQSGDRPDARAMRLLGLEGFEKQADMIHISAGPASQAGWLLSWLSPTFTQLLYAPDKQTWIPAASVNGSTFGRYFVCVWNQSPCSESDLRKKDARKGQLITLGNGEQWRITTPQTLERYPVFADGAVQWVVDEQFNWLSTELDEIKATALTTWIDAEQKQHTTFTFDDTRHFLFLCDVLAINYRITPELVVALRLFSNDSVRRVIAGLMGMDLGD